MSITKKLKEFITTLEVKCHLDEYIIGTLSVVSAFLPDKKESKFLERVVSEYINNPDFKAFFLRRLARVYNKCRSLIPNIRLYQLVILTLRYALFLPFSLIDYYYPLILILHVSPQNLGKRKEAIEKRIWENTDEESMKKALYYLLKLRYSCDDISLQNVLKRDVIRRCCGDDAEYIFDEIEHINSIL